MERQFKAIVVGIENYDDAQTWRTLDGVRDTAARVAKALGAEPLEMPEGGRKAEAPRALKDAVGAIPERGTLLVHWIGHGATADQHYLVCRDSPGPSQLDGYEAFPSGELGRIVANSQAERVVVILDTCYSGEGGGNLAQRYRDSLARTLDRQGWQRVACVIAASHPLSKAVAGRFSQGMVDVLENPDRHLKWSRADAYIDPERLAAAVRDKLGEENKEIHPRFSKEGFGQDIIPNPLFRPSFGADDLETRRHLEAVFGEHAHFNLAARGIEAGEAGYFFTGRRQSQIQIIEWLNGGHSNLMIVTGPPGCGKSALIGRIVTLSVSQVREQLRAEGALFEADLVPPDSSVDIAIHAKGKSVFQIATALGRAIKLNAEVTDQPGIAALLERMEATGARRTIVIDALDEAGGGQAERIANEIIRPLAAMPGVRILVGTRRSLNGALVPDGEQRHDLLVKAFGAGASILDLSDEPETTGDITEFVARRLLFSTSRGSDAWIAGAGRRVAAAAEGSFLYARLVARSLAELPNASLDQLPADATAAFAEDIASRFGNDYVRVTDMLRALAFGLGLGLSRAVWAPIASALATDRRTYTDDDIVWMLRRVGSYIVETTVETSGIAQAVYRLIHQALAEYLQREPRYAHRKIVETLTGGLEGEAWLGADAYLRRHLLEHAVLADRLGVGEAALHLFHMPLGQLNANERRAAEEALAPYSLLDRVFRNPAVLAISEPAAILAMRPHLLSDAARRLLGVCRLAAEGLSSAAPPERWSLLHLTGLIQGDAAGAGVAPPPGAAAWRGIWSRMRPATPHLAIRADEGTVYSVGLARVNDRTLIVSGGGDGTVRLWDPNDGTAVGAPLKCHTGPVRTLALVAVKGRTLIVTAGGDGTARRWDAENGMPVGAPTKCHKGWVESVAVGTVNGKALFVSGGTDGMVRLWDAEEGTQVETKMMSHEGEVLSVALGIVDGRALIVSGGSDGAVRRWSAHDGTPVGSRVVRQERAVCSVVLGTVNGRGMIVTGGWDGTLRRWDAIDGTLVGAPLTGHRGRVKSVALNTFNGRALIVSCGSDGAVRLWDAQSGTEVGAPMTGHEGTVQSVALGTFNGRALIASGGSDGKVRCWEVENGTSAGTPIRRQIRCVESVALGMVNGRALIVSGRHAGAMQRWSATDGTPVGPLMQGHVGWVESIALGTVNGRDLIVSGGSDGTVRLWDAQAGTPIGSPMRGHGRRVQSVALGMVNGRALIASGGSDGTVRRWSADDGTPVGSPMSGNEARVHAVALGVVNGQALIVSGGSDGRLRRWSADDGTPIGAPMTGHLGRVQSVALGIVNDRALIVSGGDDHTVRIWDAGDGTLAGALTTGHTGWVQSVAMGTLHGRGLIVSGGKDGRLVVWDAVTSHQIMSIPLGQSVLALILHSDGQVLVSTATGFVMLQIQI